MRISRTIVWFAASLAVMSAADSPFVGTWKLNPGKSQFTGTTSTYEMLPSGEWQVTADGMTFKFKMDGKEYPSEYGSTQAWKQIDANTWESTFKMGGMTTMATTRISPDGKTMTVNTTGKKPNGDDNSESFTSTRVSGGPGLAGKWKTTKVSPTTESWEITAYGEGGITVKSPEYNMACSTHLDGKDFTCTGPTIPKDYSMSARKTGSRSIEFTEKIAGKAISTDVFTVSTDGKTMTDVSVATGSAEKVTGFYDKQ
jgi:hypothetical protein